MIKFGIAFDNNDVELGDYFRLSKEDIISFIAAHCQDHNIIEIPSIQCNQAFIDFTIPQINADNFLFLAYSHGNHDSLTAGGAFYIKKEVNSALFVNSLFYSMSCLSARELGSDLIGNGCHAFVGFKENANALLGSFQALSIECDNYAIKAFINGAGIKSAVEQMKANFTDKIDQLILAGEPLRAAYLRQNRDALWFDGVEDLVFTSFNVN